MALTTPVTATTRSSGCSNLKNARAISQYGKFLSNASCDSGCFVGAAVEIADHRGYVVETYSHREFARLGIANEFVRDNQSLSVCRGTVRGLHFQLPPHPQAKLVPVLRGAVYDVAVDLRRGSPTIGRWCCATLSAKEVNQLFILRGFAHGFCSKPGSEVAYKVDAYYAPECDAGFIWDDPDPGIGWPLSEKDAKVPRLADFRSPFAYAEQKL